MAPPLTARRRVAAGTSTEGSSLDNYHFSRECSLPMMPSTRFRSTGSFASRPFNRLAATDTLDKGVKS